MGQIKKLGIFCGSNVGADSHHMKLASDVGDLAARNEIEIIYGGAAIGLMNIVANSALKVGGKVTGVIPSTLNNNEIKHPNLTNLIITSSMHERKSKMYSRADAFAILPGGLGTLDEFFEIITWRHIGLHNKEIFVVDKIFWSPLSALLEHLSKNQFCNEDTIQLVKFVQDAGQLFQELKKL